MGNNIYIKLGKQKRGYEMKNKKALVNNIIAGYEGAGYEMCRGMNCVYMCKRGYVLVSIIVNNKGVYVLHGKRVVMQYV